MGHVLAMIFTIILIAVGLFVAAVVVCLIVMPEPKTEAEKAAEKSKADASSYVGEKWVTFDKHGKVTPNPPHLKTPQLTSFPDVDSKIAATNRLLSKAKEVSITVEEKYFMKV